jgi:hypothetical protein
VGAKSEGVLGDLPERNEREEGRDEGGKEERKGDEEVEWKGIKEAEEREKGESTHRPQE